MDKRQNIFLFKRVDTLNVVDMEVLKQNVALWFLAPVLLFSLLLFFVTRGRKKPRGLPPGPPGLPLVGFLPFLSRTEPHKHLDQLRKQYGDIYGMQMGSEYYLILNDFKSVKEAFNMNEFTLRPDGAFQVTDECANFASTYGQHWVDHRRVAAKHLRQHLLDSDTMEQKILQYAEEYVDRLDMERSSSEDGEVSLRDALKDAINGSSFGILSSTGFSSGHESLKIINRFQEAFDEYANSMTVERFLPWLKPLMYFVLPSRRRIYKCFKDMEALCWSVIEAREKEDNRKPSDFMDYYMKNRNMPNMADRFTRADLNGDMQMLMFASADTVRSTLEWYLLVMAQNQQIQDKVYQEISQVLDPTVHPRYQDRTQLPYTEATILESMRYLTLVPLNPMHSSTKDKVTEFRGYRIPGNTVVIANLWAIHNDPSNWIHPDRFYPEHFLTPDEKSVRIPDEFVPFGIGKRICIGDKLASVEVFIFVVRILQKFRILPPKDGLNMAMKVGVTTEPYFPNVRLVPRQN